MLQSNTRNTNNQTLLKQLNKHTQKANKQFSKTKQLKQKSQQSITKKTKVTNKHNLNNKHHNTKTQSLKAKQKHYHQNTQ